MQSIGPVPTGTRGVPAPDGVPSVSSRLSTSLEVLVLVTMSAVTSLLLCVVAAGAL